MTDDPERRAILLMAYGSPDSLDDVPAYFTQIRGGREPSPEAVAGLVARYAGVGGRTPLLEHTRNTAAALSEALSSATHIVPVYLGMKHWHPFIADTLRTIAADGIDHVTAIALAPHYSRISIGGYRDAITKGLRAIDQPIDVTFVERWHGEPEFIALIGGFIRAQLSRFDPDTPVHVVFTAHSLPERIRTWDDPYESELRSSAAAVALATGIAHWSVAWQSSGTTGEPWIGPDILDHLAALHSTGVRQVLQVPIGFVSEHLEILWDIDVEAATRANELGITFRRTELPNARPEFIRVLASVARNAR